ncbi:MAG TPA: LanC-like protein [Gaiellaceae bacterium]|nr:LanC-like protein [Gaiellaceae bacterium]
MLYPPELFEPLTDAAWDEARARDGIAAIVADTDAAYGGDALWPADEWDGWETPTPLKSLYAGAAGVVWALELLRRRGYAESRLDLADVATRTLEAWRAEPDFIRGWELPSRKEASLFVGETGPLLVAWMLGRRELRDDLLARIRENADSEAVEVMWGVAGTMLVARAIDEHDAWEESAAALRAKRGSDGMWTNRLFGADRRSLSPPHGLVGNMLALGGGDELATAILAREAVVENGFANWPASDGSLSLQWCNGAPGVVIHASGYLDKELARMGAELVWHAGPPGMEKGPCICHGTAGNGYAFLRMFERTGDELWLDRARRFAVHALEQVGRRGRGRYSLFTGDLGVALYAADCVDARAAYPVLDYVV